MNVIMPWRLRQMCHELVCEAFSLINGMEALDSMGSEPGLCIQSIYPEDINASVWATSLGAPNKANQPTQKAARLISDG